MAAASAISEQFEYEFSHDNLQGEFELVRIEGTEGVGELYEFNVQFVDSDPDADILKGSDAVGYPCGLSWKFAWQSLGVGEEGDFKRDIHGLCSSFRPLGKLDDLNLYELTIRPKMWLLTRNSHTRIFKEKKPSDIIQEILSDYGVQCEVDSLGSTLEYVVQYQETDFTFISRLIERIGATYAFEHSSGSHKVKVKDAKGVIGSTLTVKYDPVSGGLHAMRRFTGVSATSGLETNTVTVRDWDFESAEVVSGDDSLSRQHGLPNNELKVNPGTMSGQTAKTQSLKDMATVLAKVETAKSERVIATGYVPDMLPGDAFTIEENPIGDEEYVVLRAHHSVEIDLQYRSGGGGGGGSYFGTFEAIPSRLDYPSPMLTPWPKITGCQTAVVVEGHESDPENMGRIKVQYPWDDGDNTYWARCAQLWADDEWGAFFFPRVGMEVLVDFLLGDPDRPIVVGALYHGKHAVPDEGSEEVKSGWQDAASNILSFDDTSGSEKVYLHAQKDLEVVIENDENRTLVQGNQTIDVQTGKIDVTAAQKITMTVGAASITIEPAKITLSAPQIEITADATLDASSPMTTVKGTSILTLQGGLVKIN